MSVIGVVEEEDEDLVLLAQLDALGESVAASHQHTAVASLHAAIAAVSDASALRRVAQRIARVLPLTRVNSPRFRLLLLLPAVFAAAARLQLLAPGADDCAAVWRVLTDAPAGAATAFSSACAPHLLDALSDCATVWRAVGDSLRAQLWRLRASIDDAATRVAIVRHCFLIAQRLESADWVRLAVTLLGDVADANDRSALLYVVELSLQHSAALSRLVLVDVASRASTLATTDAVADLALLLLLPGSSSAHRLIVSSTAAACLVAALQQFNTSLYVNYASDTGAAASSSSSSSLSSSSFAVDSNTNVLARGVVRGIYASRCANRLFALAQCLAQLKWRSVHSRALFVAAKGVTSTAAASLNVSSKDPLPSLDADGSALVRRIGTALMHQIFLVHEGARSTVITSLAQPLVAMCESDGAAVDGGDEEDVDAHVAVLELITGTHSALCLAHHKALLDIVSQLLASPRCTHPVAWRAVSAVLRLCRASAALFDDAMLLLRKWIRAHELPARSLALCALVDLLAHDSLPHASQRLDLFRTLAAPVSPLRDASVPLVDVQVRPEWRDLPAPIVVALLQATRGAALAHETLLDVADASGASDASAADIVSTLARELSHAPSSVRAAVYAAFERLHRTRVGSAGAVVPTSLLLAAVKALLVRQLARFCRRDGDVVSLSLEHCFDEQAAASIVLTTPSKSATNRARSLDDAAVVREDLSVLVRALLTFDDVAPDSPVSFTARAVLDALQRAIAEPDAVRAAFDAKAPPRSAAVCDGGDDEEDDGGGSGKDKVRHVPSRWTAHFANELKLPACSVARVSRRVRCALLAPLYGVFVSRFEATQRTALLDVGALVATVAGTTIEPHVLRHVAVDAASDALLLSLTKGVLQLKQAGDVDVVLPFALDVWARGGDERGRDDAPAALRAAAGVVSSRSELECTALQCVAHVLQLDDDGERCAALVARWSGASPASLACAMVGKMRDRVVAGVELPLLQAYVAAASAVALLAPRELASEQLEDAAVQMLQLLDEFRISHATVVRLFLRFVFDHARSPTACAVASRIVAVWAELLDYRRPADVEPDEAAPRQLDELVSRLSFSDSAASQRASLALLLAFLTERISSASKFDASVAAIALDLCDAVFWRVVQLPHDGGDGDDDDSDGGSADATAFDARLMSDGTVARCLGLVASLLGRVSALLQENTVQRPWRAVVERIAALASALLIAHRSRRALLGRGVQQRLPALVRATEQFLLDLRAFVGAVDADDLIDAATRRHLAALRRSVAAFERAAETAVEPLPATLGKLRSASNVVSRKRHRALRSRNAWIDAALADETGNDTFADLEDFIEE
jgi:ribosomal protein L14